MRYVRVGSRISRELPGGLAVWVPMALLVTEGSEAGGGDSLYVYCSIYTFFEEPDYVRVLSSFRDGFPGLEDEQPLPAVQLSPEGCTRDEFSRSLERLTAYAGSLRQLGLRAPSPVRLALSHMLSPVRWVVGDTRGVEEGVAAQIASHIIEDIASELARALTTRRWEEGYVLHTIELETGSVYYVIGNKVARNTVLSRALKADRTARSAIEKLSA